MVRFLKKGLLLGVAALFLCCTFGCKSTEEKKQQPTQPETQKGWGDDTRQNILDGVE